jgi:hypothetical protein
VNTTSDKIDQIMKMDERILGFGVQINSISDDVKHTLQMLHSSQQAVNADHNNIPLIIDHLQQHLNVLILEHEKETQYLLVNMGKPHTKLNFIEKRTDYIRDKIHYYDIKMSHGRHEDQTDWAWGARLIAGSAVFLTIIFALANIIWSGV